MFTQPRHLPRCLVLLGIFFSTNLPAWGAEEDFATIAKQTLAETHAQNFQAGNIRGCVAIYAGNAKFFVDNKLIASGEKELLEFYQGLRDVDGIRTIEIDKFVDLGSDENFGWVIFNYTKVYDLKNRDPKFLAANKLTGFATVNVKQYGTAIFAKIAGHWKVRTMTVFDPEIWERKK